ncbi:MAG: NADPH-dependent F420 reductase [Anaerolineales bacterium]
MKYPVIAILGGTGKEGAGLALRWAAAGYKILIGSRQLEKAQSTAEKINRQLGIQTVNGLKNLDAAKQADICVLTVVHSAHLQALESVRGVLGGKILVDTTSRVDYRDPKLPVPPCAAQEAQNLLGQTVRVVAAFQNVPAKSLISNINSPINADVLVCSDNIPAAEQVIELANAAGMRGYYAGILANANIVEGMTTILINLNKHYGVINASIRVTGIPE